MSATLALDGRKSLLMVDAKVHKMLLVKDVVHGTPKTAQMPPVHVNFLPADRSLSLFLGFSLSLSAAMAMPKSSLKCASVAGVLSSVITGYLVRRGCCARDWSACDVARVKIRRLS